MDTTATTTNTPLPLLVQLLQHRVGKASAERPRPLPPRAAHVYFPCLGAGVRSRYGFSDSCPGPRSLSARAESILTPTPSAPSPPSLRLRRIDCTTSMVKHRWRQFLGRVPRGPGGLRATRADGQQEAATAAGGPKATAAATDGDDGRRRRTTTTDDDDDGRRRRTTTTKDDDDERRRRMTMTVDDDDGRRRRRRRRSPPPSPSGRRRPRRAPLAAPRSPARCRRRGRRRPRREGESERGERGGAPHLSFQRLAPRTARIAPDHCHDHSPNSSHNPT